MPKDNSIETRLARLEQQVDELRRLISGQRDGNWLRHLSGSMRNYPEFDEVLRLGEAARRADTSNQ